MLRNLFLSVCILSVLFFAIGCETLEGLAGAGASGDDKKSDAKGDDKGGGDQDVVAMMLKNMKAMYHKLYISDDVKEGAYSVWSMGGINQQWTYVGKKDGMPVLENRMKMGQYDVVMAYVVGDDGVVKECYGGKPGAEGQKMALAPAPKTGTATGASDWKTETKYSKEKVKTGAGEFDSTKVWSKATKGDQSMESTAWYGKAALANPMMPTVKDKDGNDLGTLLKSESGGKTSMELVKTGTDGKSELKLPG